MSGLARWKKLRERMVFILCGATGLRIGEALGLEIDKHLSPDFLTISIEQKARHCKVEKRLKTASASRQADLHPEIAAMLKRFAGERKAGFLFCTRNGEPLGSSCILRRHLHPALKHLGFINPFTGSNRMSRRSPEVLDGARRWEHVRSLRQDQRGRRVPQELGRKVRFWL